MSSLCDQCSGLCCRYFAFPIDNPECAEEFDNIRWYLCHENVVVFIEDKQWYMGVMSRCKNLQNDNRCGIYETRPNICRKYTTDNCDYHGGDYEFERLFTSAEDLRVYGEQKLREMRAEKRKKARRRALRESRKGRPVVKAHPGKVRRIVKPPRLNGNAHVLPTINGNPLPIPSLRS